MSFATEGALSFSISSGGSSRYRSEDKLSTNSSFWEFIDEPNYPLKETDSCGDPIKDDMEEVDEEEEEKSEEEEEELKDEEDIFGYDGDDED